MLRVKALDHVGLKVTDMDKSLEFYQRVLGLTVLRTSGPSPEGVRSAVIKVGNQEINVFSRSDFVSLDQGDAVGVDHFCLNVDAASIHEVIADLRQVGAEISAGPTPRRDGISVVVLDPDGIRVELRLPNDSRA